VIELQVFGGSAAHTLATQHLDETITPSLLPGLVVAALELLDETSTDLSDEALRGAWRDGGRG
jgi:hypothetical protein